MAERLLTVKELAERLNMSEGWIYAHLGGQLRPKLPAVKLGRVWRFRLSAVEQWIEQIERGESV